MGSVDGQMQNWSVQGQLAAGGVVRARSDMSRYLSESHAFKVGVGFSGKDLTMPDVEATPRSMWVGSVSAEDYWRLTDKLQVGYGLRFEHYNYLQESGLTSPRVQVAYAPIESVTFTTGVSYDAEAPGLAELRFEVDPLAVRYMDILSVDGINPERTLHTEVGVRSDLADTMVSARAFHDEIDNELVGFYVANESGSSDYLVANVGDAVTQGLEVDVRRSIMRSLALAGSYAYARRDGGALPAGIAAERGLIADEAFDTSAAAVDVVHEIAAGVETVFGAYDTRVNATYRWKAGVPVVRDGNLENLYTRLDVRVRQPLPFRALASDWSALVQVQNLLGHSYDGVFDFRLGNAPVLSRLFSGGLAVRF
jgi:outer membrane receptor protein involved in Fe transport